MTTDLASPPVSPNKETKRNGGGGSPLERKDTADSMDMRNMAKAARSPVAAEPRNKRRGGRRGAPERGRGSGASDKRAVIRCTTADSMDMKAMQNGLRAAPVSAAGNDDDIDNSERPPSPMLGGPPLSVGVLLDCEDHSASTIGDEDE
jgi:hypothetical protein